MFKWFLKNEKWNLKIRLSNNSVSLFQYSQFWYFEISVVLHFIVPNFDRHLYLLVDYQTCCRYKNVQFLYFANILFVNKFRLLTQVTEVLKIYPIFSVSVYFDINSDENLFLVIDITKNRYFNIDSIINLKNTIR